MHDAQELIDSAALKHVDTIDLRELDAGVEDPRFAKVDPSLGSGKPLTVAGAAGDGFKQGAKAGGIVDVAEEVYHDGPS